MGADFRVLSHLSIDVPGAENDNVMSSCANLPAAPSDTRVGGGGCCRYREDANLNHIKKIPFFHRMGLDVGADDVDNDIYQALHGVYSGQS